MKEDKEFIDNLHYILPNLTEHQWKLLLPIIQGRVYSKLEEYNQFLLKNNYTDSDIYAEEQLP